MLLHRHRAILWWCSFGQARLNSRGVGLFEKPCFVPDCILKSFSAGTYRCLLKLSVCLKCRGGGGGVLSSWVSCCCTDTGLSCGGVHLGKLD